MERKTHCQTAPEAVGSSVPLVLASKQILKEKALAKCQVIAPRKGDAFLGWLGKLFIF